MIDKIVLAKKENKLSLHEDLIEDLLFPADFEEFSDKVLRPPKIEKKWADEQIQKYMQYFIRLGQSYMR